MTKNLKITLTLLFLLQVIVSANFELAHDEAYYWLYSKNLAWGYFDHPPFVGVVIRMFSYLGHSEWAVRIGFILMQFASLGMIFKMIPRERWMQAALLFFAFPLASMSGLFALPDMPLLFMTCAYCLGLKSFLEKPNPKNTLVMGLIIPILLYAKYHGILLVFFTILALPKLLLKKELYLIALLSILLLLPHGWWQYDHNFATLRYHFIERPSSEFSLKRIFEYLSLQIFLPGILLGPVVWWTCFKHKSLSAFERSMKFMAFGIVIFFLISTLSKKFEANWTIPVLVPLVYFASLSILLEKRLWKNVLYVCLALTLLARFVLVLPPNTLNIKRQAEFHGWRDWAIKVKDLCGEDSNIMANSYQIASKLSFYLNREVPALNYHSRKNQFDYWKFEDAFGSDEVCYITDKREFQGIMIETPEKKKLNIVTSFKTSELLKLKADHLSQTSR